MALQDASRFTRLEVTGDAQLGGKVVHSGLTENTYKITSASATAAAGEAPTKTEFDKVVTLINEIKTDYNKLVKQLCTGSDT